MSILSAQQIDNDSAVPRDDEEFDPGSKPSHWTNDRKYFFKYLSRATARLVLSNNTLRWSTPATLNDPHDTQFSLQFGIDRAAVKVEALRKSWDAHYGENPVPSGNPLGALIRAFRGVFPKMSREEFDREFGPPIEEGMNEVERTLPSLNKEIREQMAMSKILCLSAISDSSQMWAYYAESHQGAVVRFKSIPKLDSPWGAAFPVKYSAKMPSLIEGEELSDLMSGRSSLDAQEMLHKLVYTKGLGWAHEREWRVYSGDGRAREALYEDIPFHVLELDALILGCRMPMSDKDDFVRLTRRLYPHTRLLQAVRADTEFGISTTPLDP